MKTNFIMIAVAIAVLVALLFARRELQRALEDSSPESHLSAPAFSGETRLPNPESRP